MKNSSRGDSLRYDGGGVCTGRKGGGRDVTVR